MESPVRRAPQLALAQIRSGVGLRRFTRGSPKAPTTPALRSEELRGAAGIEPLAHFFTGLEVRRVLLLDRHVSAGARVAAGARWALLHRERTEAAQLDAVAARHCGNDLAQDGVDNVLDVALIKVRILLGDFLDQLRFDHGAACQRRCHIVTANSHWKVVKGLEERQGRGSWLSVDGHEGRNLVESCGAWHRASARRHGR